MKYTIKLTYFKVHGGPHGLGGKYYSSGEYSTEHSVFHLVLDEVEALLVRRELPGLTGGHSDYHVLVDAAALPSGGIYLFIHNPVDAA